MLTVLGCSRTTLPQISNQLFDCPEEPLIPNITTDADFIEWVEDVRVAGDICRNNLKSLKPLFNKE